MIKRVFYSALLFVVMGYGLLAAQNSCLDPVPNNNQYFDSYEIAENAANQPVIRIFYRSTPFQNSSVNNTPALRTQLNTDIPIDNSKFVELIMARLLQANAGERVAYALVANYETYYFERYNLPVSVPPGPYFNHNLKGFGIGKKGDDVRLTVYLNDVDPTNNICWANFDYNFSNPEKQIAFDYVLASLISSKSTGDAHVNMRIGWKLDGGGNVVGIVVGEWENANGFTVPSH